MRHVGGTPKSGGVETEDTEPIDPKLRQQIAKDNLERASLTCFYLHSEIFPARLQEVTKELLWRIGFDIIYTLDIGADQLQTISTLIHPRISQFTRSAGGRILITLDLYPESEPAEGTESRIDTGNYRALRADQIIKNHFSQKNLHSAPNGATSAIESSQLRYTLTTEDSWNLLTSIIPEQVHELRKTVHRHCEAYVPPFPIVETLKHNRGAARTDVVRYQNGKVVCKTFRRGRLRFFNNELERLQLKDTHPALPPIIAAGENWILSPYYERASRLPVKQFGLIPLHFLRRTFEAATALHYAGYAHLDLCPANVLVTRNGDIRLIDFERLHKYREGIPTLEESPMLKGCTNLLDYDTFPEMKHVPNYSKTWSCFTGLSLHSMIYDPAWLQHLKRTAFVLRHGIIKAIKRRFS